MATLQITSVFTGKTWEGEVETTDLEEIYRLFNRVDGEDAARLEKLGFEQPSMSEGDLLILNGQPRLCVSVGFANLTPEQASTYAKEIAATATSETLRPPFMPDLKRGVLRFLGNNGGYVEIDPSGNRKETS